MDKNQTEKPDQKRTLIELLAIAQANVSILKACLRYDLGDLKTSRDALKFNLDKMKNLMESL